MLDMSEIWKVLEVLILPAQKLLRFAHEHLRFPLRVLWRRDLFPREVKEMSAESRFSDNVQSISECTSKLHTSLGGKSTCCLSSLVFLSHKCWRFLTNSLSTEALLAFSPLESIQTVKHRQTLRPLEVFLLEGGKGVHRPRPRRAGFKTG